jgi:hypothetical protein
MGEENMTYMEGLCTAAEKLPLGPQSMTLRASFSVSLGPEESRALSWASSISRFRAVSVSGSKYEVS